METSRLKPIIIYSLIFAFFVFAWGSVVYLLVDSEQGWVHGLSTGVILTTTTVYLFLIAFRKGILAGLITYVITWIVIFLISGLGLIVYQLQGCPKPRTAASVARGEGLGEEFRQQLVSELNLGCSALRRHLRVNAEFPQTYTEFVGSLVGDPRVWFLAVVWLLYFSLPLGLGYLLGKILHKQRT